MSAEILLVDADAPLRAALAKYLEAEGFGVACASDANSMYRVLADQDIDLIVLDVLLPGEDGLSICRRLAQDHGPPIIIVSATEEENDRVVGLEMGADDYLAKPCSPRELLARIRSVLRRRRSEGTSVLSGSRHEFRGFTLEMPLRILRTPRDGGCVLTPSEAALLLTFISNPRRSLSRAQLIALTRGLGSEVHDRAIDVQMSRLRRKLYSPETGDIIRTIRGVGYVFDASLTGT